MIKLNIADYPNLKKSDREKIFKKLRDIAFPKSERKVQTMDALEGFK